MKLKILKHIENYLILLIYIYFVGNAKIQYVAINCQKIQYSALCAICVFFPKVLLLFNLKVVET